MSTFKKREKLTSIFRLTSIILNSKDLIENGISPNIQSLLPVSFAITYLPAIIMSSGFKPFVFTFTDAFLYAVGLCLSLIFYNKEGFLFILKVIPNLSKCIYTYEKIKSNKFIENIIIEDFFSEFIGIIIKKLILKQKLVIKSQDMYSILIYNIGIFTISKFRLPDFFIIILVYWFSIYSRIEKFFIDRKFKEKILEKKSNQISKTSTSKTSRRKASVSYKMDNKAL